MPENQIQKTAHIWSHEALFSKAQSYASIMHEKNYTDWEFGFWSSLALEMLVRAALSSASITLIADNKDYNNLLFSLGKISNQKKFTPKSIDTSEVLKRLENIFPSITVEMTNFCTIHFNRRNSEVHSGDLPFLDLNTSAWLPKFYWVCEELCKCMNYTLQDLIGKKLVNEANEMILESLDEKAKMVTGLINAHKTIWENKTEEEKQELTLQADIFMNRHNGHRVICPACSNTALVQGKAIGEPVTEIYENEIIQKTTMKPSIFECIACGLKISGYSKLIVCELANNYLETTIYEPTEFFDINIESENEGYFDDNNEFY